MSMWRTKKKFNANPICVTTFPCGLYANTDCKMVAQYPKKNIRNVHRENNLKTIEYKLLWNEWAARIRFLNHLMQVYNFENVPSHHYGKIRVQRKDRRWWLCVFHQYLRSYSFLWPQVILLVKFMWYPPSGQSIDRTSNSTVYRSTDQSKYIQAIWYFSHIFRLFTCYRSLKSI